MHNAWDFARQSTNMHNLHGQERWGKARENHLKATASHQNNVMQRFFVDHHLKQLKLFKRHRFLLIILSKNHVGKDRLDISKDEVWTSRDFAERLQLKFNSQTQTECFGQSVSLSLEGVAVRHLNDKGQQQLDFHSFISSNTQQDSAVVHHHSL